MFIVHLASGYMPLLFVYGKKTSNIRKILPSAFINRLSNSKHSATFPRLRNRYRVIRIFIFEGKMFVDKLRIWESMQLQHQDPWRIARFCVLCRSFWFLVPTWRIWYLWMIKEIFHIPNIDLCWFSLLLLNLLLLSSLNLVEESWLSTTEALLVS